jgi:hypothetical protein
MQADEIERVLGEQAEQLGLLGRIGHRATVYSMWAFFHPP